MHPHKLTAIQVTCTVQEKFPSANAWKLFGAVSSIQY